MTFTTAILLAALAAVPFHDNFRQPLSADHWRQAQGPQAQGQWTVGQGKVTSGPHGPGWLVWQGVLPPRAVSMEADITPEKGGVVGAWCAAGLAAWRGPSTYWRLALVEGATDKSRHYFELVESLNGLWQAQNQGATALTPAEPKVDGSWSYGHTYHFRLVCDDSHVEGTVTEGGKTVWRQAFRFPASADASRGGFPALTSADMVASFADLRGEMENMRVARHAGAPVVAVLNNDLPGADTKITAWAVAALKAAGLRPEVQPIGDFVEKRPTAADYDVVVVPSVEVVPVGFGPALSHYLASGGQLAVTASGLPFGKQLMREGGKWVTPQEAQSRVEAASTVVPLTADLPGKLGVQSNEAQPGASATLDKAPAEVGGEALDCKVKTFDGWCTWGVKIKPGTLTAKDPVVLLWAKGDKNTGYLTLELKETDGARWIGAFPITTQWRRYGITPSELPYWNDSTTGSKRGGPGDSVRLADVGEVRIGLAQSHSPIPAGPKEFWVSAVQAGPLLAGATPSDLAAPTLEGITPFYKTFPYPKVSELETAAGTTWPAVHCAWKGDLRADYARPWSRVVTGLRQKRWVPVLAARDAKGGHMYAASLTVEASGQEAGASWSYWGLPLQGLEAGGAAMSRLFGAVVAAQARRLWMIEAGPDQVAYMPGQSPKVGARVVNLGGEDAHLRLAVRVTRDGKAVATFDPAVTVPALSEKTALEAWTPPGPGVYEVSVELRDGGRVIDRITSPARIMTDAQPPDDRYVRVEDGLFRLDGKPWYAHGVNFWPRYVSGMDRNDYWIGWQYRPEYDPVLVEEDLRIAQSLGITAVSIQPPPSTEDLPCLWDFLARCKAHGIHVNLFVNADPRGFDETSLANLIEKGHLSRFATIFAYDIVWEPHLGGYAERSKYDRQWRRWIDNRYGSVAAAEKLWGYKAPRDAKGQVTGPSDDQLASDGDWRVMVAAYRHFVDDMLSAGYGRSCRFLHRLDPHHLISNRAGYGGTGNPWPMRVFQFDPRSGGAHLDFISPEAYGMTDKQGDYKRWGYVDAYCRWCTGGKPVFWAEYGNSIWPGYTPADYARQQGIWRNVQELVVFAGADGDAGWWWPGGYRVDEKSDFGCIEPWGEPRPSALELKQWAAKICDRGPDTRPVRWMTIDRDAHADGLAGMWAAQLKNYLAEADNGAHLVKLRTAQDGKNTVDMKLEGVGDVPFDGMGPVQGLDSEVSAVDVVAGGQSCQPASDLLSGDIDVAVPAGKAATVRLRLINTGEAGWACEATAAGKPGAVRLVDATTGKILASIGQDVPRFGRVTVSLGVGRTPAAGKTERVAARLEAAGRCRFGQVITLVLKGE